ncbi:uncharacterized protein [Rutidosis leptorrhynchoides]|uniref:uncharacterized protein n=1 Tax=Rutidosis leptorrhynchoides TaxID=125765 RepID=UPI003A9A53D2
MESGNGVHIEDEKCVVNVETNEVELSKLEVTESCEDVNGTKMPNSVEVKTNEGASKKNKVAKNGPTVSSLTRKPKTRLTQSLSFPAKPQNESMKTSIDGHPMKPRAALSNGNAVGPTNRRASAGVKTKETGPANGTRRATLGSGPSVRPTRPTKSNASEDVPSSADPVNVATDGQQKNTVLGFSSRLEERAEKRKEFFSKIEEKIHAKEVEKTTLQEKSKESQEAEIKQLRKSLKFKAAPMPKFYKEPPPKVDLKKIPTTRPKSPKLGRNKSNVAATSNGTAASPHATKNKTETPHVNATDDDKHTAAVSKKPIRKTLSKTSSSKTEVKTGKSKEKSLITQVQEEEKVCEQAQETLNPDGVQVEG